VPVNCSFNSFDKGDIGTHMKEHIHELVMEVIIMIRAAMRVPDKSPLVFYTETYHAH
jgi:hypothetical protein